MHKTKKTTKTNKTNEGGRKVSRKALVIVCALLLATASLVVTGCPVPAERPLEGPRNVIFFHPDGYGLSHWNTLRYWLVGPDGRLNWDKLPYMAPYTGHMKDSLTGSSHGGATVHAYGVKVAMDSFGLDGHQEIIALSGKKMSIMEEAIEAGFATALIQSGCITEPGTAAFVASTEGRGMREEQALQVIESEVDVILGGGESWLLHEGVQGRHGTGRRKDGVNLIERAKELGYTIVYTRDELIAAAADPAVSRVLGAFASGHTFNDRPEEVLRAENLPLYWPWAPTMAEMSAAALEVLSRNPKAAERGIFLVAEDEGTDNFPNNSNAVGSFEAGRRADEAFGVFADFIANNPNTLLITAADSDAGSKNIFGRCATFFPPYLVDGKPGEVGFNTRPDGTWALVPLDGADGAGTELFLSAPDKEGKRWPFAVAWMRYDVSGGILARAKGLNARLITELGVVDNTDIYRIMYYTLFGEWLGERP
jgi:alkaline phosphatase